MAIIKHSTSKNANYSDVLTYYSYKHKEDPNTGHYEPILDDNGLMQPRDNYAVTYITAAGREADPHLWEPACIRTNRSHGKNNEHNTIRNHEYIISHPAADRSLMTTEDLLEEGRAFVRENLPGFDALLAVHRDTDNDHVHITINSVRALDQLPQPWTRLSEDGTPMLCDTKAGFKHRDSPQFRRYYFDWLTERTRAHGLTVEDNNQRLDERREAEQLLPPSQPQTKQSSKNAEIIKAIKLTAPKSSNLADLGYRLQQEWGIQLVRRGNTISFRHPQSKRNVRLDSLGLQLPDLYRMMPGEENKFTQAAAEEVLFRKEEKKNLDWMLERRIKNTEKAEAAIRQSEAIIRGSVGKDRFQKEDFQALFQLVKKVSYLEKDLQLEADKMDRLLDRWKLSTDPAIPEKERWAHSCYVRWAGADPSSKLELAGLQAERETLSAQLQHTAALRESLTATASSWTGRNDLWHQVNDLDWLQHRKESLKGQLQKTRASRKKLGRIAINMHRLAVRRIFDLDQLRKADRFLKLWLEKLQAEKAIQQKIRDLKKQERDAKAKLRRTKKQQSRE